MDERKKQLRERWQTLLLTGLGLCLLLTRVHLWSALIFFAVWILVGWLFPPLTNAVIELLKKLRIVIGRTVMSVLLAAVYLLVLLPASLWHRRCRAPGPASTWVEAEKISNWGDPF